MKFFDVKDLSDVCGAGQSGVAIRQPVRKSRKVPADLLPLPKPGPVFG